jgi:hypothetical protein
VLKNEASDSGRGPKSGYRSGFGLFKASKAWGECSRDFCYEKAFRKFFLEKFEALDLHQ